MYEKTLPGFGGRSLVDGGLADSGAVLAHEIGHQLVSGLWMGLLPFFSKKLLMIVAFNIDMMWMVGWLTAALCLRMTLNTSW
jgi:hypothetical protein